ncbi:hypothetical protein V6N11_049763 [Hibiscus sabdariffa]|uniref:DUF4005 domain-containing protein n=1 Tax=Hibiscus sabdariffa TaxID=183260 RepID=A0ABR2T8C2_9ROSI
MGKKGKWLSYLKKAFISESKEKKNQKSKEQFLEKKMPLDPTGSNAAALESVKISPRPLPEEVKLFELRVEQSKQTYPATAENDAVAPATPGEVVRHQLNTDAKFAGKSKEEVAAMKIQTAFRGYLAKRALCALRGLVRLKSLIEGPAVKRQAASSLQCMQTLSLLQCQIRARRIWMTEENQTLQKQLLQKHAKELVNLQSKQQIDASLLSKHEAAMRRERAMAYSFTHQQTWKNASRSMNPLFLDPNNPSWGWSWMERRIVARPWEGRGGMREKEQMNDQSSTKSAQSNGGEINKAYAPSIPARKLKSASPRSCVVGPDDDTRSIVSMQFVRNRRHSIAGSLVHDDESLSNSPSLPSYMVPTKSARAKTTRLQSPLGLEPSGTPEKEPIASVKKRLSYPPSPARSRQHSGPTKLDSSITNTEVAMVNSEGS